VKEKYITFSDAVIHKPSMDAAEESRVVTEKQCIEFVFEDINTEDKVDKLVVPNEIVEL
jgi:hypothetical protein